MGAGPLAFRGEVVLGMLLVTRHRAVRLAGVLAVVVVGLALLAGDDGGAVARRQAVFAAGGSLAAVAASRLLAPGAALAAGRQTGGPWWRAPVGRLTGAWLVVAPPVAAAAVLLVGSVAGSWAAGRTAAVAALHVGAVGALVLAVAPLAGASAAAAVGLAVAWLGGVPPSVMGAALDAWPYLRRPVVLAWNTLPLDWRAGRWLRASTVEDLAVLAGWIALGCIVAAWAAARAYRRPDPPNGSEP